MQRAVAEIEAYSLVCLTSPNGVRLLFESLAAAGRDARALAGATVAAIGPGTAAALAEHGIEADVVPERFVAEALLEALGAVDVEGRRVLVARAAEARDVLPDGLRERGAEVDDIALYETVREEPAPEALAAAAAADYVTFTSSSTVRNLTEALGGRFPNGARVISIGPVTSEAAREAGLTVDAEAERHDIDGLVAAAARRRRAGAGLGSPHRHFRVTDSTNSRARELAEAGAPGGTVVTAAEQTAGRGRQGRSWTAPPGGALLYSAIVRPLERRHALLPLAAAIAVSEAAERLDEAVECRIKWPNDIWVDGRKLAGILIEARPQDGWAVIGVGHQPRDRGRRVPGRAARDGHLADIGPRRRGGADGARREARAHGSTRKADDVLSAWEERDALRGREISWDGGSGVAEGVSEAGDLLVLTAGGDRVALGAGEVHLSL